MVEGTRKETNKSKNERKFVPVHCTGVELDDFWMSHPTQMSLWFYDLLQKKKKCPIDSIPTADLKLF